MKKGDIVIKSWQKEISLTHPGLSSDLTQPKKSIGGAGSGRGRKKRV